MDFRELINKIDSINSEAKKEPERLAFADAIDHVKDIKFTPPLPSGIKFSSANNVKFKGQDINDPKVKLALFQDELKNSPARLLGEIGSRIKPTSDAQMDLSGHIASMGEKLAAGSNQLGSLSEPEKKLAVEAIKAALRSMELERDPDQSEYKDDEDDSMESSLPWKKYESSEKQDDKVEEGVFDKDGMLGKFVKTDTGTDVTTGEPNAPTFMGFNVATRDKKIEGLKNAIKIAQSNDGSGRDWKKGKVPTIKDVPRLRAELAKLEKEKAMQGESFEEGDNIYHSCVKSFKHAKFGEGEVLHGEHTLSESGEVSHYDAKFVREDGSQFIVRNIPVANMKECVVVEHGHPKKKKKVKEEEVVDEAHYQDFKTKGIDVNKDIELAGDSIWDKEGNNPKSVHVKKIGIRYEIDTESDDAEDRDTTYVHVQVEHDGPWTIYTDSGFERAISQITGMNVNFTEQGMQEDGEASLEGSVATKDIPADAKPVESVEQEDWFQGQTAVTLNGDEFYETFGWIGENDENIEEAEYQGRSVKLNKPMRGDVKKFKVYVKNPKGNVVKVNFGDPDMKIKKSNPARRKSFRARHNCDTPGPKHKARYWSCRKW